ncbi:hypothetical protein ACI0FM_14570 [Paenochrobactrum sp. BZR 588]|uniref:hypothetical protein n=1 Tax=Paenochrobactrum sp. BZR 588 TaxID=3378076 RepID=UPI003854CE1F
MIKQTYHKPVLIIAFILGVGVVAVALVLVHVLMKMATTEFQGTPFHSFLHRTKTTIIEPSKLRR